MQDIDEMDLLFFLRVLGHVSARGGRKAEAARVETKSVYIDELWA